MKILIYYWSKILKKLRGSAIKNSDIHKTSKIESGSQVVNSSFGRHSFCGYNCQIVDCEVGSFTSISNNVVIGGGMHPMSWVGMSPVFYEGKDSVKAKFSTHKRDPVKRTIIGNDVWIGESVLIKQGVTVGNGAVIGMGSVVTKDIYPYSIVAGNPAKMIRKRFSADIINSLMEIQWWNFSDDDLLELSLYFTDPQKFIERICERNGSRR